MDNVLGMWPGIWTNCRALNPPFCAAWNWGNERTWAVTEGTGSYLAAYNLGVYYEVVGETAKAIHFYRISANQGYRRAKERLSFLSNG